MIPTESRDEYLAVVGSTVARLDAITEYGIPTGEAAGLLVLHGVAMYARDTARAAVTVLLDGQTFGAGVLTRVVIEHAVLAQWLRPDPESRGLLFLRQGDVERHRWHEVIADANLELILPDDAQAALKAKVRKKNVAQEFDTPRNLFGDNEMGRQLYLTYRNLSQFVHPSAGTFSRYTYSLAHGLQLSTHVQAAQDPEAIAFYLASALVMCALPYLDLLDEPQAANSLLTDATAAGLVVRLE